MLQKKQLESLSVCLSLSLSDLSIIKFIKQVDHGFSISPFSTRINQVNQSSQAAVPVRNLRQNEVSVELAAALGLTDPLPC